MQLKDKKTLRKNFVQSEEVTEIKPDSPLHVCMSGTYLILFTRSERQRYSKKPSETFSKDKRINWRRLEENVAFCK